MVEIENLVVRATTTTTNNSIWLRKFSQTNENLRLDSRTEIFRIEREPEPIYNYFYSDSAVYKPNLEVIMPEEIEKELEQPIEPELPEPEMPEPEPQPLVETIERSYDPETKELIEEKTFIKVAGRNFELQQAQFVSDTPILTRCDGGREHIVLPLSCRFFDINDYTDDEREQISILLAKNK